MIPFKLFKYLYFTEILYTITYGIFPAIVIGVLVLLNILVNKNTFNIPILIISTLCAIFTILYTFKSVLNDVIFCKYKKIKVITNLKTIDWVFFLRLFVLRTLVGIVIDSIFDGISYIVFEYDKSHFGLVHSDSIIIIDNIIGAIGFITFIITDYCIANWYLSKYISVSLLNQDNEELQ